MKPQPNQSSATTHQLRKAAVKHSYLRDHVHSHGIASLGVEANVEIPASESDQELLQPSKPANNNSGGPFNTHITNKV